MPGMFQGNDASGSIATGGTSQAIFNSQPVNGFAVYNPDPTNDLWINEAGGSAVANGQGCKRIAANGGWYETPPLKKPTGNPQIVGASTGQKYTAERW